MPCFNKGPPPQAKYYGELQRPYPSAISDLEELLHIATYFPQ